LDLVHYLKYTVGWMTTIKTAGRCYLSTYIGIFTLEKWYLYNHFGTTFVQLSLSYSHYVFILSLPFSLSIVFDQWKERTTRLYQSSCSNITTLYAIHFLLKLAFRISQNNNNKRAMIYDTRGHTTRQCTANRFGCKSWFSTSPRKKNVDNFID